MHVFALILGIWLLPKGDTLTCYECIPDISGTCTETQRECPSQNHQCGASRVIFYIDTSKTTNGRQCFTCDGLDGFTCDTILACEGNEDHCVTTSVSEGGTTATVKGCISELLCSSSNSFLSQRIGTQVSCCKGNFCNSAVTASAGLQLVVVALVSLALFS